MEYRLQIKGVNTSWMTLNTYTDAALVMEYLDSLLMMAGPGWQVRVIGADGRVCNGEKGGETYESDR